MNWSKHVVDPAQFVFEGTTSGDAPGTLTSKLLNTGRVVMNGTVIDGYLSGAQVHEEGQLVDPATLSFEGFLRLMPSTAG